jgi:hypothetical protein
MLSRFGTIRCLFFRLRISHALDGKKPLRPRVKAHLLGCPDCRRFHSTGLSLAWNPKMDSNGLDALRGTVLAERAVSAAGSRRARRLIHRSAGWNPRRAVILATGMAVVLLAALMVLDHGGSPKFEKTEAAAAEEALFKQGLKLLNIHLSRIGKTTLGVHVVKPLKAEVERLAADAESVQSFFLAIINQAGPHTRPGITER